MLWVQGWDALTTGLHPTVCTPSCTQCPNLPFQFGCSSHNFSILGERPFLPATAETTQLITLLCGSPLCKVLSLTWGSPLVEPSCAVAKLHSCRLSSFLVRGKLYFLNMLKLEAFSLTSLTLYSLVSRLICVWVTVGTSNDNKPWLK